jgi:hypothetical protein
MCAVVTTLSDWENELAALRADLGPTRPMLMTWVASYESGALWRRASVARWEVVLYPPDASGDDSPVAFTYLPAAAPLPTEQPILVDVAGRTDPGGALAFRLPTGEVLYGSFPAGEPGSFHRWRLLQPGRKEKHDRLRRTWAASSALPRGMILLVVALVSLAQQLWMAAGILAAVGFALLGLAWRSSSQAHDAAPRRRA